MRPLPILLPFSCLYGIAMELRNLLYEQRMIRSVKAPVPVISVGNITSGGTGKTPIVELIATMLRDAGKRTAIVTRGYRRLSKGFVLVSDGVMIAANVDDAGDEAYQMAKKLDGVSVIADEQRVRGALRAVGRCLADVVVLDDGFQHRALARDCDIVLIDVQQNTLSMPLLPAGHRREPLSGLRRADAIIFTKCDVQADYATLKRDIRRFTDAPVFTSSYRPVSCISCPTGESKPLSWLHKKTAVVFCGIGQPDSFLHSAKALGIRVASFHPFPDHHRYSPRELKTLAEVMTATGAEVMLTTEKDARRLDGANVLSMPLAYLAMEAVVHENEKFATLIYSIC